MADGNQIKSSDLYLDDHAFDEALKGLEAMRDKYVKMLDSIVGEAQKLIDKLDKLNTTTNEGREQSSRAANDAEKLKRAQNEYNKALDETNTEIRRLKDERRKAIKIQTLETKAANAAEGSYDKLSATYALTKIRLNAMSKAEREATVSGKKLEKQARDMYEEMNRLQKATGKHQLQVGNYPKIIPSVTKLFAGLVGTFGLIEGIRLGRDIFNDLGRLRREAKGIEFAFNQISNGQEILERARQSTKGLLSDLDIKKSANEFKNFNIDVSALPELLEFVSVRAVQTGKDFKGLRDSLVEGLSKESKLRIDNLGISTQQLNDELKKTPNFVQAVANIAKREVAKAEGVLDSAANAQEQFNANLENFKVLASRGFVERLSNGIYKLGSSILRAITPAKSMTEQFEEQAGRVIDLENNLEPLIKEYDNLKGQTKLNAKEQDRLKELIKEISDIVPGAITQFDEYGNALDISSDKAKDFIESQKALLKFRNREAIKEETKALDGYRRKIADLNAELSKRDKDGDIVKTVLKGAKIARTEQVKLSNEVIAAKQAELAKLKILEQGALKSIDELSGEFLEKYKERERKKTEAALEELREQAKTLGIHVTDQTAIELKALIARRRNQIDNADKIKKEREKQFRDQLAKDRETAGLIEDERERELALFEIDLREKRRQWQEYGLDVIMLDKYEKTERQKINDKFRKREEDETKKQAEKEKAERREVFSDSMETINQYAALRESEIDLLEATEEQKSRLRLKAEADRLKKVLALNKKISGELSALQIQEIKNQIKKIDAELSKAATGQKDIYEMLGLKLNDEQKQAISDSLNFALENLNAFLEARVQAAEIAVQKANEEASAAQARYDAEIEARNNGYANQVLTAQRELELARKKEQQALKDKEKAQKAQERIDQLSQVSGLITASVEIWKALAGIKVIGPILAAAAVATMFGSYAAAKIKARTLAKEKLGEGGFEILHGGSHASGNDIPIGVTKSGKERTAEGGEALAVIKKSSVQKYGAHLPGIVNSLNRGNFEKIYGDAFMGFGDMAVPGSDPADLSGLEDDVRAIRESNDRREYIDGYGRLVVKYKNLTTIYV